MIPLLSYSPDARAYPDGWDSGDEANCPCVFNNVTGVWTCDMEDFTLSYDVHARAIYGETNDCSTDCGNICNGDPYCAFGYYESGSPVTKTRFYCDLTETQGDLLTEVKLLGTDNDDYLSFIYVEGEDTCELSDMFRDTITEECVSDNEPEALMDGRAGEDLMHGSGDDANYSETLVGGDDDDAMYGHEGDDILYGNDGWDIQNGGDGADTIYGNAHVDIIQGGDGDDTIYAGPGVDHVCAGNGEDYVDGGAQGDHLWGGPHTDYISGGDATSYDWCEGGDGDAYCDGPLSGPSLICSDADDVAPIDP